PFQVNRLFLGLSSLGEIDNVSPSSKGVSLASAFFGAEAIDIDSGAKGLGFLISIVPGGHESIVPGNHLKWPVPSNERENLSPLLSLSTKIACSFSRRTSPKTVIVSSGFFRIRKIS